MSDEFEMEVVENDELDSYTPPDSSSEADIAPGGELEREQSTGHGRSKMQTANSGTVQLGPKELSIPSVWNLTTFEEANESEKPIGYGVVKPGPHIEDGIPLIRITDVIDGRLEADQDFHRISDELDEQYSRSRLDGGELLVSIQGTVGEVVVAPPQLDGANISRTLARISPGEGLNTHWVKYFLESKEAQDYMEVVSSGSTRASYNIGDIRKTKLPVPPLPEQRKIASVLYAVDQAIQKTEAIIEQAKRVKRGLMQKLFLNGTTEHSHFEEIRIGPKKYTIPSSWSVKEVGDSAEVTSSQRIYKSDYVEDGVPFYRSKEIIEKSKGKNPTEDQCITREYFEELDRKYGSPKEGDILITAVGTTGVPYLVNDEEFYFKDGNLQWIKDISLDSEYVSYFMETKIFQDQVRQKTAGSSQGALTIGNLQRTKIIYPTEKEVSEITDIISSVEKLFDNSSAQRTKLQVLKKGLMQDLLTGEVRTAEKAIKVLDEVVEHG